VLGAYLRLIEPGHKFAEPSIGRLLTTAGFRGRGLGREAMQQGLRRAAACYPGRAMRISAQARLEHFYAGMGFHVVSAPYEEDGITHIDMLRAADAA
jgi:ElaA protein